MSPCMPHLFFYLLSSWHLAQPSDCRRCTVTVELKTILRSHQLFSAFLSLSWDPTRLSCCRMSCLLGLLWLVTSFSVFSALHYFARHCMDCSFLVCLMVLSWPDCFGVESCRDSAPVSSPVCHPLCVTSCPWCDPGSQGQRTCFPLTVFSFFGNDPLSPADFQD